MSPLKPWRVPVTLTVALVMLAHLGWQHFNGGIPSHHLLHRSDLPAISNAWGALVLPLLTWLCVSWVIRRDQDRLTSYTVGLFVAGLLYGAALALSFTLGLHSVSSLMGPGLLLIALFFPIYRPEAVLGFVLAMTFTFGAVLPTGFAAIVGLLAWGIYRGVRPIPVWVWKQLTDKRPVNRE